MKAIYCLCLLLGAGKSFGQPILLCNPSFEEDKAKCCTTPTGWYNCGSSKDTPPDIQPGSWGIDLPAAQGKNYLSLVVRDNGTTEAIGQKLSKPLEKDSIYLLSLSGARAPQAASPTKKEKGNQSFATPVRLKVWGGNAPCDKKQLLAETALIMNTDWSQIELILQPGSKMTHIFLEADYKKAAVVFLYNGNVLIDNLSLTQIP